MGVTKIHDRNHNAILMNDMALQNNAVAVAAVVMIDTARPSTTIDHLNVRVIETAAASVVVAVTSNPGTTMIEDLAMMTTLTVDGVMMIVATATASTTILPLPTALKTTATEDVRIVTTRTAPVDGMTPEGVRVGTKIAPADVKVITKKNAIDKHPTPIVRAMMLAVNNAAILQKVGSVTTTTFSPSKSNSHQHRKHHHHRQHQEGATRWTHSGITHYVIHTCSCLRTINSVKYAGQTAS
jgi:hypothetical protein